MCQDGNTSMLDLIQTSTKKQKKKMFKYLTTTGFHHIILVNQVGWLF